MITETTATVMIIFNVCTIAVSAFLVHIGIDTNIFFLFAVLLGIDYLTGLLKARAIKESITSNKMKYGVISKFSLIIIPITLALGGTALGRDFSAILDTGMTMLVLSEIYSIISNVYAIRTHEELPEYDVIALIGKKIRNVLLNYSGGK